MSYAPLWLEIVVTSILFTATLTALSARSRGLLSWLILLPNCAAFLLLSAVVVGTAFLRFSFGWSENFFAYSLSLLVACSAGAIVIQRLGALRDPGLACASARWNLSQFVLGTLISVVVVLMTLWNMDLEVRNQAEAIRTEAGQILLSVSPANVSDSENAAIPYETAFSALRAEETTKADSSPLFNRRDQNPGTAQVEALLGRQAGTIALLREAANMPGCRSMRDYSRPNIEGLLTKLRIAHVAIYLLRLDAEHQLASGSTRAAIEDVGAMFALSRATGQEPIILAGRDTIGSTQTAAETLAMALSAVNSPHELTDLHIGNAGTISRIITADLRGEEAFGLAQFADIGSGRRSPAGAIHDTGPGTQSTMRERITELPFRIFFLPADIRSYQQLMEELQKWSSEPYFEAAHEMRSDQAMMLRRSGILTRIVAPVYAHIHEQTAVAEAIHSAALVGVAITRYRLDHATLPDTLNVLVPEYLDAIPIDPFDGQPMRYRKTADDWRVYSLGPAGKDQGGDPYDSHKHTGNPSFVVKNSAH